MSDWTLLNHQVHGQNAGKTDWPSFVRLSTGCGASFVAHDKILTVMEHATKEGRVCGERRWALVSAARARAHASAVILACLYEVQA